MPKKQFSMSKKTTSVKIAKPEAVAKIKKNKTQKEDMASKKDLLDKYQGHKNDTGSTEVQIVLLTKRIKELSAHLKEHAKDFDSKRGLLIMLGKRRRLLNYLDKIDKEGERYPGLIQDLGLRR